VALHRGFTLILVADDMAAIDTIAAIMASPISAFCSYGFHTIPRYMLTVRTHLHVLFTVIAALVFASVAITMRTGQRAVECKARA
jgi:hypothetical protein